MSRSHLRRALAAGLTAACSLAVAITLPRRPAAGRYRVRAIATDASGNRSASKSARFRAK